MRSKIYSLTTLFIIFFTCFIQGQDFWQQTSAPGYITAYAMFQDENGYIYAGAYGVGIYRSTNSGSNWSLFTSGLTNLGIWCISGDYNGTLYLGTNGNQTASFFKSTNSGQTWTQITSLPPSDRVNSILAIKGTRTIFIGNGDGIYRSTNKGVDWLKLTNGVPTEVFSVTGILKLANGDILAAINSINVGSQIFRSTDSGDTWLTTTGNTGWITKIAIDNCNNYLYSIFNYGDLIWLSVDNGYSWEVRNNGIISNITSDLVINPQHHLFLATQGGFNYQKIYKSTNYGNSWNSISSGLPNNVYLTCLLMAKDGNIFAGTYYNNNGYGIYKSVNPTYDLPYVLTDAPENLTQTSVTLKGTLNPNGLNVDYFFEYGLTTSYGNVTPAQAGGSGNTNLVVSSNISGLQQNTPYHNRLVVEMCDGTRIYGNDLQFSTLPPPSIDLTSPNGGENWQVASQKDITWTSVSIENVKLEYTIDGGIYWNPIINYTPAISGSYTWTIPDYPSTQCKVRIVDVTNSFVADTSSNTFTISEAPGISVSTPNAGAIWQALSQQTVTWSSVNVLGNVNIKLSTDGSTFPIILKNNTPNDGTEEITVPNNPSSTCRIRVESFGNPTNIFGLNNGNFTITPPVDVDEILNNQPTEYSLYQNFPNPFNPVTRIYYAVPKESQVSIKLFNTLGEEILTLVNEIKSTGNYWVDLDGKQLQSGVYIYQMESEGFQRSKKLTLVK